MGVALDHFDVGQKQAYVVAGTTIGLVLAIVTYAARMYTRLTFSKTLHREDWWMGAALFVTCGVAACLFYQLSVGLARNIEDVSKAEFRKFMIGLWVIQRLQPLNLFCIKTSIILFYVHVFDTPRFKLVALIVWIYTLLWTISIWFATLFECHPVSFYWDRDQEGGHCVKNPLITIGLTSGVLSCVGDIVIFAMPIPVLSKLNLNPRKKAVLIAIFLLGLFVVCTSFIRWVALLGTDGNITSTQVEAGVWTFLEGAIGITCANLPLMGPLFRRWLSSGSGSSNRYNQGPSEVSTIGTARMRGKPSLNHQFSIIDSPNGSEVELANRVHISPGDAEAQGPGPIAFLQRNASTMAEELRMAKRPNFLVILADDLGYSDLGCYGSEIKTPHIDKLAGQGLRFTGLGSLIEWVSTQERQATARGKPGYEGYLNERVVTLPEVLRDAGYLTLFSGKWHLGLRADKSPFGRGFDRSFAHLPGASNHYGWEPQLDENLAVPPNPFAKNIPLHMEDGEYVKKLPEGWYSSNGYGDILLRYLRDWQAAKSGALEDDRPFFAYYAFTAPHWPLQAPQEYVDHYRGVYDHGPDALRHQRLERLKEAGLVDKDVQAHPVVANGAPSWEEMSAEQRALSARSMEVYAGMVECMDYNVGKVVDYLQDIGELDNTFVMFLSDNGAEGAAFEAHPAFQGGPMEHLQKYYNNSLENIGKFDSFAWYGPRWAQAATAPMKLYKAFTTEGGIRVPLVAKFPKSYTNIEPANGTTDIFSTIMDIAPTCLEMAGVSHPAPSYKGREIVGMRGKSMVPWLKGESKTVHGNDFVEGWEMCGRAAVRKGYWKAVFLPAMGKTSAAGSDRWELFNLEKDQGETKDLSKDHPEILAELLQLWDKYVLDTGVVPFSPALGDYIAATEEQMPPNGWMEYEYWKKGAREEPEKFFVTPKRFDRDGRRVK
ncbi:hypothetical protein NLG97_g2314 [Lecanicillium saksenae]|uniref:Uncharacterized protein n=1 Tax=Lecanicillium saksenae TaxID=468837 RepID=A0ACC1R323_9HYPO|nr:hypothetical protein NLG97_g2314 [Lecanicillium saksenae]